MPKATQQKSSPAGPGTLRRAQTLSCGLTTRQDSALSTPRPQDGRSPQAGAHVLLSAKPGGGPQQFTHPGNVCQMPTVHLALAGGPRGYTRAVPG